MAATQIKMGFEGIIYTGSPGSTASGQALNTRDVKITLDPQMGDTTARGDSSVPPIETEQVSTMKWSATVTMLRDLADSQVNTLMSAAAACTPVALRMIDHLSGQGFDGDCNVKVEQGIPLKGEQTVDFTFTPNRKYRTPQLYV